MIPWWDVRAAAEPLTPDDILDAVVMADTKGITKRYCEERIKRGMRRGPWPLLPEEPTEPWERLPIPLLCRLLHEPLITERLLTPAELVISSRYAFRVVESPWRFHIGVVP